MADGVTDWRIAGGIACRRRELLLESELHRHRSEQEDQGSLGLFWPLSGIDYQISRYTQELDVGRLHDLSCMGCCMLAMGQWWTGCFTRRSEPRGSPIGRDHCCCSVPWCTLSKRPANKDPWSAGDTGQQTITRVGRSWRWWWEGECPWIASLPDAIVCWR